MEKGRKNQNHKGIFSLTLKSENLKQLVLTLFITMLGTTMIHYFFWPRTEEKWFMFIFYIPYMIVGGGLEEFGWRGFLHPYLKGKIGFFPSVLITGFIWAGWHIPLWFISCTTQTTENFPMFILFCVALAMVLAVIYEITGNVLACIIIHAWSNVLFAMFSVNLASWNLQAVFQFLLTFILSALVYCIYSKRKGA